MFLCFDGGKKRVESEFFLPAAPLSALSLSLSLSLFLSRSAAADPYLGLPGVVLGLVARLKRRVFVFRKRERMRVCETLFPSRCLLALPIPTPEKRKPENSSSSHPADPVELPPALHLRGNDRIDLKLHWRGLLRDPDRLGGLGGLGLGPQLQQRRGSPASAPASAAPAAASAAFAAPAAAASTTSSSRSSGGGVGQGAGEKRIAGRGGGGGDGRRRRRGEPV